MLITLLGVRHSPFPTNPHEPINSTSIHFYLHVDTKKSKYHLFINLITPFALPLQNHQPFLFPSQLLLHQ
ncbi:hypothetical protein VNO80_11727 [Phaseolus coccineus]|uniref:Uncharacterized protein n=1 Tax=Phaseolus coccineus TaxID=3886 RepID=A0AAN9NFU4_PHACN